MSKRARELLGDDPTLIGFQLRDGSRNVAEERKRTALAHTVVAERGRRAADGSTNRDAAPSCLCVGDYFGARRTRAIAAANVDWSSSASSRFSPSRSSALSKLIQ